MDHFLRITAQGPAKIEDIDEDQWICDITISGKDTTKSKSSSYYFPYALPFPEEVLKRIPDLVKHLQEKTDLNVKVT